MRPVMREWSVPQYSAQNRWNTPGLRGRNQSRLVVPGTTSCLMRNAGMKNEWMTSCDDMISRTAGRAARAAR